MVYSAPFQQPKERKHQMSETKNALAPTKKGEERREVAILKRLADESPEGLAAQITQMTGDPMFTRKFVQCVKNAVTAAWKMKQDGTWYNPFQVVPLNSVLDCLYECASRHILPDGYNAYLVCYCGKNPTCQLLVDYKGMVDTAVKEGIVQDANADVVCENDTFVWDCGDVVKWTFDFRKPRGRVMGACAWAVLPDGRKKWVYVPMEDLQKIRACVRDTGIWDKWTDEMYKKTAIRRLFKTTRNTPAMNAIMDMDARNYDLDKGDARDYGTTKVRNVLGTTKTSAALPPPDNDDANDAGEVEPEAVLEPIHVESTTGGIEDSLF